MFARNMGESIARQAYLDQQRTIDNQQRIIVEQQQEISRLKEELRDASHDGQAVGCQMCRGLKSDIIISCHMCCINAT